MDMVDGPATAGFLASPWRATGTSNTASVHPHAHSHERHLVTTRRNGGGGGDDDDEVCTGNVDGEMTTA